MHHPLVKPSDVRARERPTPPGRGMQGLFGRGGPKPPVLPRKRQRTGSRGEGVPELSEVRHPGSRVHQGTLPRLRLRLPGGVLMQGPRGPAPPATPNAWPRRRLTWWTMFSPTFPSANGSSPCRNVSGPSSIGRAHPRRTDEIRRSPHHGPEPACPDLDEQWNRKLRRFRIELGKAPEPWPWHSGYRP